MKLYELKDHPGIKVTMPMQDHYSENKFYLFLVDKESTRRIYFGSEAVTPYVNSEMTNEDRLFKRLMLSNTSDIAGKSTYDNPYKAAFYVYHILFGDSKDINKNFMVLVL